MADFFNWDFYWMVLWIGINIIPTWNEIWFKDDTWIDFQESPVEKFISNETFLQQIFVFYFCMFACKKKMSNSKILDS